VQLIFERKNPGDVRVDKDINKDMSEPCRRTFDARLRAWQHRGDAQCIPRCLAKHRKTRISQTRKAADAPTLVRSPHFALAGERSI
jgi:hypothetical protein